MWRKQLNIYTPHCTRLSQLVALAILLAGCFPSGSMAQQTGQKIFSSPEEASNALFTALQSNNEKELLDIFGPDHKHIVRSGDDTEDAQSRTNFVEEYKEMHRLAKEPDGTTTLIIGARNWPTPIPLVNKNNSWYFDTEAGAKEILFRRIGRNEISAIRVCQELVAAEKEYRSSQHDEYASKILSDEGQHNGLYWRVTDGEPQSPIGPLVASAVAEGYAKRQAGPPTPYRGYYFHILTKQGKNGPGGARSYIVHSKMTEGFAFLAYPAEYRSSGVMTFIVNQDGVVLQKDLGKKTDVLAKAMKKYNPDSSWRKADEQREETAGELQSKWQVGTIAAVQCHQVADAVSSNTSCEVSLKVGDTVYVALYKPPFGIDTVFATGRELEVLIGEKTLMFNDLLGDSYQVPILSRTIVTAQAGQETGPSGEIQVH
jgi:hypothetical protein